MNNVEGSLTQTNDGHNLTKPNTANFSKQETVLSTFDSSHVTSVQGACILLLHIAYRFDIGSVLIVFQMIQIEFDFAVISVNSLLDIDMYLCHSERWR